VTAGCGVPTTPVPVRLLMAIRGCQSMTGCSFRDHQNCNTPFEPAPHGDPRLEAFLMTFLLRRRCSRHQTWTSLQPSAAAPEPLVFLAAGAVAAARRLRWRNMRSLGDRCPPGPLLSNSSSDAGLQRSQSRTPPTKALPGTKRIECHGPACGPARRAAIGKLPGQYSLQYPMICQLHCRSAAA
jgi:hypothetical protein